MGVSRAPRPDPHFVPTQTSFDVRGASCVAIPFSRVFLTYRIRSLSSTFSIVYRSLLILVYIRRLWLNRLRIPGTAPLGTGPVYSHGFSPIPHNIPLRFEYLSLLKEGGMLADLVSTSVLTEATFII